MLRNLIEELHAHFSVITCPTDEEKRLLSSLTHSLAYFPITSITRDDLRSRGFDTTNVDDSTMKTLVSKLSDGYYDDLGWVAIDARAESLGIPKYPIVYCPKCEAIGLILDATEKKYECSCCTQQWSDVFVRLQIHEDASYFSDEEIGYPCSISKDPKARYVSEHSYIEYFGKSPNQNSYCKPIVLPESRAFLIETFNPDCEHITDEHGIEVFGAEAIWVPLNLWNAKKTIKFDTKAIESIINQFRKVECYVADEYTEQRFDALPQLQTEELILADFDEWLETAELDEAKFRYEQGLTSRGEKV